jgi:hypothetical protein
VRTVPVEDLSGELDRCSGGESGAGGLSLLKQLVDEQASWPERQSEFRWSVAEVAPRAVAQLVAGHDQVGRHGEPYQFLRVRRATRPGTARSFQRRSRSRRVVT